MYFIYFFLRFLFSRKVKTKPRLHFCAPKRHEKHVDSKRRKSLPSHRFRVGDFFFFSSTFRHVNPIYKFSILFGLSTDDLAHFAFYRLFSFSGTLDNTRISHTIGRSFYLINNYFTSTRHVLSLVLNWTDEGMESYFDLSSAGQWNYRKLNWPLNFLAMLEDENGLKLSIYCLKISFYEIKVMNTKNTKSTQLFKGISTKIFSF